MRGIAVVGIATALAVAFDPAMRLATESTELRAALQAAQSLIAVFAAYLLYGRFQRRRLLSDLLLVYALGLLATVNLFLAVLPSAGLDTNTLVFQTWAPLVLRIVAITAFAAAAVIGERQVTERERPGVALVYALDITLALVAIVVATLVTVLPPGVEVRPTRYDTPDLIGHPLLVAANVALAVLCLIATFGFLRRVPARDPLISALAAGSLLSAFSFLCYAIYPSTDTPIVQAGDLLGLGSYLVLLVGAEREIANYRSRLADMAVFEERRRLARDLHDGVAQELAYVVSQTRLLMHGRAPVGTDERIAAAAQRALDESRRAISALTNTQDEPLHMAIARAAEDVGGRLAVDVRVDASPAVSVTPDVREALVRIVRESITNAARHGNARHVDVAFGIDGVLSITDDGCGFTPENTSVDRFGLISMRERAEGLGARFRIESAPGQGTRVEVALG